MARYRDSVCRLCRREAQKLFLKGDRCYSEKCAVEKRNYPPGQHGHGRPRFSDFGVQLREKQKVKRMYGLLERQFAQTVHTASRMKGRAGENLLALLERRLDNVVFKLGFATSRAEARQLVRHGHFLVNGRKATIPSMLTKPGMTQWLEIDKELFEGTVKANPVREDITLPIEEQLIVELYSRY
jgi:small subunit ribosomal protein S4